MPLNKAKGNMYSGWVTHVHTHLAGECPHRCSYCLVQAMAKRFPSMKARYSGPLRLIESELQVNYGTGKTIFIEHLNDLFADAVPANFVVQILQHCAAFPDNTYVFQTKNPARLASVFLGRIPPGSIIGTTIETNRAMPEIMRNTPSPFSRHFAMMKIKLKSAYKIFVTIEPILDFNLDILLPALTDLRPAYVNIGADSKGHGLPEPSADKVLALINGLKAAGIEVRRKSNLDRLLNPKG